MGLAVRGRSSTTVGSVVDSEKGKEMETEIEMEMGFVL